MPSPAGHGIAISGHYGIRTAMATFHAAFPIPYAHWYAATLFLDAGHPAAEILARAGLDEARWQACRERYAQLHFANTSWVAGAYERAGLPSPAVDRAMYAHLLEGGSLAPALEEPFGMRGQLQDLRRLVEADPHIGPFADADWVAHYLCERRFPTIRYVHDGKRVMVGGEPLADAKGRTIEGIDPAGFRKIGERWFRDGRRVYGQGEKPTKTFWFVMRGADPDSFTVLNERYARDKAAGYYVTNRRLPCEDAATFAVVGYCYGRGQKPGFHVEESHYAKDSRRVYAYGVAIAGADAPSFEAIGDEGRYFADKDRVYWEKDPIEGADRDSFACASEVGQYRAYDRNRPYRAGKPLSVVEDFESWRGHFEDRPDAAPDWWRREKARREGATASSDTMAPKALGGPYVSDGERVLVMPRVERQGPLVSLDHFDHASFRHIAGVFGVDRHGLRYFEHGLESYGREPVKGADPGSFEALGHGWYRDSRQAYYYDDDGDAPRLVVVKADPGSFEVIGGAYARDANGLICEGVRKRGIADPAAVVSLGHLHARIGDVLLYRGKPVSRAGKLDVRTARSVHDHVLIDARGHMLLSGRYRQPIPALDPQRLRFLNRVFAVDDARLYASTQDALVVCEDADRGSVEVVNRWTVRDAGGRLHVAAGRLRRTSDADEAARSHFR